MRTSRDDELIFYWCAFRVLYLFFCWLVESRIKLKNIKFSGPKSRIRNIDIDLFDCDVSFGQSSNSICFDAEYLMRSLVQSRSKIESFSFENIDWLSVGEYDKSWSRKVENILIRFQEQKAMLPNKEKVAEELSVTVRRLGKVLVNEQESFQKIKTRVRKALAMKLLTTTDLSITTIGYRVGYSETAAFTRSFGRWVNMTPSAFREASQMRGEYLLSL